MKRLTRAPNLAIATMWADLLCNAGIAATVQRMYASSIAGELPPDQALPEVWISDDDELERARALLHELRHPVHRHWACRGLPRDASTGRSSSAGTAARRHAGVPLTSADLRQNVPG